MSQVISEDGTIIKYLKTGKGPVVILVDGAFCNKDFGPMPKLASSLSEAFTVISYDRRARGESGDTKPYSIDREIQDIAALINIAGGSACLFGISSGAILCMMAVSKGLNVTRLAILEPPFVGNENNKRPHDALHRLNQFILEGKKGEAVKFYLTKIMLAPAILPFLLRLTPNWKKMKANANSLPYDAEICGDFEMPRQMIASITIPVLVIDSTASPDNLRNAVALVSKTLPRCERKSCKGSVHDVPPKVLAPVLIHFYNNTV